MALDTAPEDVQYKQARPLCLSSARRRQVVAAQESFETTSFQVYTQTQLGEHMKNRALSRETLLGVRGF